MTNIIVALPRLEDAKGMKNILVRSGFRVMAICTAGAQALGHADSFQSGILICSYKLTDMIYKEIYEYLPPEFRMILVASQRNLDGCTEENIVCLAQPLKVTDLVDAVNRLSEEIGQSRRKRRMGPRARDPEGERILREAKEFLIEQRNMTEEEAHRYLQKSSMDSGNSLVETAQMVLTLYRK